MEIWRLNSFLVLAAELHFTRAAERLNVTQPTLSRQILGLEAYLGVPLLVRGPRLISLTDAGRELQREGELLIERNARAVDRTRRAARGDLGSVSVGFVGSAVEALVRCVVRMKELHPDVTFNLSERAYTDPTSELLAGNDDMVLARDLPVDTDWQLVPLGIEQSYLVVSGLHPLAQRDRVSAEDVENLRHETFISTRRWLSMWGFNPRHRYEVSSAQATLQLVSAGIGVSLMPGGYRAEAGGNVRFIPVHGVASRLQLVLPTTTPSQAAREFVEVVLKDFSQQDSLEMASWGD